MVKSRPTGKLTVEEMEYVQLRAKFDALVGSEHDDDETIGSINSMRRQIHEFAARLLDEGYSQKQVDSLNRLSRDATVYGSDELLNVTEQEYVALKRIIATASAHDSGQIDERVALDDMDGRIAVLSRTLKSAGTPTRRFSQLDGLVNRP